MTSIAYLTFSNGKPVLHDKPQPDSQPIIIKQADGRVVHVELITKQSDEAWLVPDGDPGSVWCFDGDGGEALLTRQELLWALEDARGGWGFLVTEDGDNFKVNVFHLAETIARMRR